jgi:hypothetical protein
MNAKNLPLLLLFISFNLFSQVGIGTANPNPSAALDIVSSNSGLLIPRIALSSTTDVSTIPSPATSLLVYNTATVSNVTPGFYFFEGTWKPMAGSGVPNSGWSLTGNTISDANFLGSTNFNSLFFRVNNQQFAKFAPNGGISIGNSSIANDNNSIAIGTNSNASASNEAIALGRNTTASGFQSTAIGVSTTASANSTVAIGNFANVSGFQSIGIGVNSVFNTNNSLAIGNNSNASGQQATALGSQANSSGQNATAIGFQATATQSNSIILGSSTNLSNRVGIGTNIPTERLHIDGSVRIVDGTQAAGRVLTSDANGRATWTNPQSLLKSFASIYFGGTTDVTLAHNNVVEFGSVHTTTGNISANNNNIRVSISGRYSIQYKMTVYEGNQSDAFRFNVFRGNTIIPGSLISTGRLDRNDRNDRAITVSGSVIVDLVANDQISLRCLSTNNNANDRINLVPNGCSLSVELVD